MLLRCNTSCNRFLQSRMAEAQESKQADGSLTSTYHHLYGSCWQTAPYCRILHKLSYRSNYVGPNFVFVARPLCEPGFLGLLKPSSGFRTSHSSICTRTCCPDDRGVCPLVEGSELYFTPWSRMPGTKTISKTVRTLKTIPSLVLKLNSGFLRLKTYLFPEVRNRSKRQQRRQNSQIPICP